MVEPAWGARNVLRDRLATVERRGGWASLRTAGLASPATDELWRLRDRGLAVLDELPRVPTHGDAHPVNLLGRDGDDVIAVDWEQFGLGPAGFDLGYLFLATDLPLDDLLAAHDGDRTSGATHGGVVEGVVVRCGAALVAAFTGVSRAAWALTQTDPGDHVERLARLSAVVDEAVSHAS